VAETPGAFARMLRELRTVARLTQEDLALASGVSLRSVSDLERGRVTFPQKETVRSLADALHLTGPVRAQFAAVARGRARTGGVAAARVLPRDVASFTGRQHELRELVDAAAGAGGVVSIHAIGGMAGVGKTAFAVHAAHRLADQFPGGQIFLPLHGHTPGHQPVDPEDALASLLATIGVPAGQIPPGLEARIALWRDRLASRRLLLILDDAASSDQVHPLMPGAGGNLVLVTSRRHLSALEDATAISLDTLPPGEAGALLVQLTGRAGLSSAEPAVREIIRLCGYLPLAIGMVARQLHSHPAWSLARRAGELAAERDRLELMANENVSVAAAFDLSYADLVPDRQRLFRRLGLHPGSEFDAYAAAALDGTDLATARRSLEALYDQYLLTEPEPGRYRMHDLIREYTRALAGRLDPDDDRDLATGRLLDYYQRAAALAAISSGQPRPASGTAGDAIAVPALAGSEQALAWLRAERANLSACLDYASATGQHTRIIALAADLAGLLRRDGPWAEAVTRHSAAVRAARHLGDRPGEANALTDLGTIRPATGDFPAAAQDMEQALDIYRELGDPLGQAGALCQLGTVRWLMGEFLAAARLLEQALDIYADHDDPLRQANAFRILGEVRSSMGDPAAAQALERALDIYRGLGDRLGLAHALRALGLVRRVTGDYPAAVQALEQALHMYRELGNQVGQANVLNYLGIVRRMTGDHPAAVQAQEQALRIYGDLGERLGQANALTESGILRRVTGDYLAAARDMEQALGICRDLGARDGEAWVLNETGTLRRVAGDLAEAQQCHQRALDLARAIASPRHEAHALAGLGRCALAAGRIAEAQGDLRKAREIFQRIGAAEAAGIAAELDALPG